MKPFTYVVPRSLQEASEAGKQPDTVLKGAGVDLIDRMKERLQTPTHVVNLLPLKDALAGVAVEANGELGDAPETVNAAPEAAGWFAKIRVSDPSQVEALMDRAAYEAFLSTL